MAIGARSQASKTYLEKKFETFPGASVEELARHALLALREACADKEGNLSAKNCTLARAPARLPGAARLAPQRGLRGGAAQAIVGKGMSFTILEDEALKPYLEGLEPAAAASAGAMEDEAEPAAAPPAAEEATPMESI